MAADQRAFASPLSGIYAIINDTHPDPVALTRCVLDGGVRIVQYRAKYHFNVAHAFALRELTRAYGALFLLNDRWQEAERFDADGAHVGPDDVQCSGLCAIRQHLGERLLGVSCGTSEEARRAAAAGANYLGVGAVYATASKEDAGAPIGIAGLTGVARAAALPIAAIGGITRDSLIAVRNTGVAMAAVISAISAAGDPQEAAAALVRLWQQR